MENIDKKVLEYKDELFESLSRLIKIPSKEGKAEENAPFGKYPKAALEEALKISEKFGFKTNNIDNAIGYAEYGESEDYIGVLGHVDVVPEGDGWDYPPFELTVEDDKLYGRGVLDNKGPIIACLYAMKIIRDLKLPISKRIRIIFGTNEESGFKDIPYYLKKEKPPVMGFTPDCKYPAVYGERGILDITILSDQINNTSISNISGNFRSSNVPDLAKIELLTKEIIEEKGVTAPGNAPEMGQNAMVKLCKTVTEKKILRGKEKEFIQFIYETFYENHTLEKTGINCNDAISGNLIVNPYKLSYENGALGLSLIFRYPISYKYEDIVNIVNKLLPIGSTFTINRRMDSVCFDKDSTMLKIMKEAYEEVTGLDGTPVTTTGGTYAKVFPNIVAYGPSFPGQKGIGHNKNEYMNISDLLTNIKIYTRAIYGLAK